MPLNLSKYFFFFILPLASHLAAVWYLVLTEPVPQSETQRSSAMGGPSSRPCTPRSS